MITNVNSETFGNCTSLTSVYLPENLTAISLNTFKGCSNLNTIEAPSFSTTILDNDNIIVFRGILIDSGSIGLSFLPRTRGTIMLHNVLFNSGIKDNILCHHYHSYQNLIMYHMCKVWARSKGSDGRLPLLTAAASSLKWSHTSLIFNLNMPVINEIDALTGLPVSMLAAAGPTSDIESIYNLLREHPQAIMV